MTASLERAGRAMTGDLVTVPPYPGQHGPCVHMDPWWKGVGGMDPALPVTDRHYAAQVVVIALSARFLTMEARRSKVLSARARVYQVAEAWREWLDDAGGEADYYLRRIILWQLCEHQQNAEPDDILPAARDLHAAVTKGSRR